MSRKSKTDFFFAWTTITYRSVFIAVVSLLAIILSILHIAFPGPTKAGINALEGLVSGVAERIAATPKTAGATAPGKQEAYFTNLDGKVRVKKANSNTWVAADYSVPLEKGDVVQTTSEGMAKVVFADGTNYTIKQDSLIVIEENSTNEARQTQVAVQVTTGTVDLATATYSQGSKSRVIVSGATASLAPESAAQVRNDPRADQHEILVKKGAGEVVRGNEIVRLTDYEKVTFKSGSPQMVKKKEIGPPILIAPANMMPIFLSGGSKPVNFSWTPVRNTSGYHLRISRNPYFSSTVYDRKVAGTDVLVPSLGEGAYYWVVQSIDAKGSDSVESEKNRFTIIPKGLQDATLALELSPFVQHGHVIEVLGKTEPSARVMVNGEEVPIINAEGRFHYFTPPLPNGENIITVTAQNARGGVNTQQKKVVIQ
ncbi:MAG TPA: hypothetical protein VGQ71_12695 [Terriglobales bacterium]|nr:hypothetical protein [Terriglobales bacterium]